MKRRVPLEPQAEVACQASPKPPLISELPVAQGRVVLEEAQNSPIHKCPTWVKRVVVDTKRWGAVPVYLVEPEAACTPANVILYIHGVGWVFSSYHTRERLVGELAARTGSLLIFPEYGRSPGIRYSTAIEQCYSVMCVVPELVRDTGYTVNPDTFTVAGDGVDGNTATTPTLMSRFCRGPAIQKQLLHYPVISACFNTGSYCKFTQGYYLHRVGIEWFWNQYTVLQKDRNQITASPLRANLEQLRGLPDTMVLSREADVLRDEGEAYAIKLRQVGVDVTAMRFQVTIHNFVVLNSLDQTKACRTTMDVSME